MHQRLVLTFIGAACLSLLACNKEEKKETSPEPAATTATQNATPESPAGGTAEDKAGAAPLAAEEKTDKTAEKNAAGTTAPDVKAPTTKVANGQKEVKTDGKDVAVKNEAGKGGVTTTPGGGIKVTGKSGKSIGF